MGQKPQVLGGRGVSGHEHDTDADGGEHISPESVDADELLGDYPERVYGYAGGYIVASIDPASTNTPVQDAIDAVDADSNGYVVLPPETVTEAETLNNPGEIGVIGYGVETSVIEFTDTGTDAHGYSLDGQRTWGGGFKLKGPGSGETTGFGMQSSVVDRALHYYTQIDISSWGNSAIDFETNGSVWQSFFGLLRIDDVDPSGAGEWCVRFDSAQSTRIGTMIIGPENESPAFFSKGSNGLTIGSINIGSNAGGDSTHGSVVSLDSSMVCVDFVNYEPTTAPATAPTSIVRVRDNRPSAVQSVRNAGTVKHAYDVSAPDGDYLGQVQNDGTINTAKVRYLADGIHDEPARYIGPASDVNDQDGGTSEMMYCIEGATFVDSA